MQQAETPTSRWRITIFFLAVAVLLHVAIFSVSFRHVIWPLPKLDSPGFSIFRLPPLPSISTSSFDIQVSSPSLFSGRSPFPGEVTNIAPVTFPPLALPFSIGSNRPQIDILHEAPGAFAVPDMAVEFIAPPASLSGRHHFGGIPFTIAPANISSANLPHVRFGDVRQTQPTRAVSGQ
jgi:hypothetical protein